jgi:hypothetical protein
LKKEFYPFLQAFIGFYPLSTVFSESCPAVPDLSIPLPPGHVKACHMLLFALVSPLPLCDNALLFIVS